MGLLVLFRPTILPFPIVIFCIWLIKKYKVKEMVKFALPVILIVVTMLTPWWIRNAVVFNRFVPLTLASGNPMLQGTYIFYDSSNDPLDYSALIKEYNPELDYTQYGTGEIINDKVERAKSKIRFHEVMTQKPVRYFLWYTIGKTLMNFGAPFYFRTQLIHFCALGVIEHIFILVSAIIGFILYKKKNKNVPKPYFWMASIAILFFNCIHLPFYCFPRYVFPVIPFLMMFSAYAINLFISRKKANRT